MKVLVACEESQVVCKAFRERGFEAYSCDLQDCSGGHHEWHIKDDAIKVLWGGDWELVIAHPPCTRLANSGVSWLSKRNLYRELAEGISFFNQFVCYGFSGKKIAIENPIPHRYAVIPKYSQIIQPWHFGHGETKATCLWLYGLPNLKATTISDGREQRLHRLPPSDQRAKLRSKTYQGIADAMAQQWGDYLLTKIKKSA